VLLVLLIAMVLSFLFSGMESAVLSVSRVRVRHAADTDGRAKTLLGLLADREAVLGTVTVANHIANVVAFGLIVWQLVQWQGRWGYVVGFGLALPGFVVLLELLPKTLFRRYPFRMLRMLVPLLSVVAWFRYPFKAIGRMTALPDDEGEVSYGSRDELKRLVSSMAQEKLLSAPSARLMERVLDLRRINAQAVMVPLTEIVAVTPDMSVTMAAQIARQHGLSVLPVLDREGHFTCVFAAASVPPDAPEDRLVRQLMRPLEQVQKHWTALNVLQRLRRRGQSAALVVDNIRDGHPIGFVTEEDLLRPLLAAGPQ
jgi:CBS domain containing-hemolysin-like protein